MILADTPEMPSWLIALIVVIVAVVLVFASLVIYFLLKKHRIKKDDQKLEEKVKTSAKSIHDKFGGKENIMEISSRGSRVVITVKDPQIVLKDEITEAVESAMFMGNKIVLVIGSKSEQFKDLLQENVGKMK